ncbi:MAG: TetR/AcrR family transcriptional regulator [Acidimicrobiales bacterium]
MVDGLIEETAGAGAPSSGDERDEPWVRAPRQARSQETLGRFVEATRRLLQERSFDDITVHDIVAAADRTVGSFYARFEDKDAVLHVLVDQLDERISDVVRAFCDPVRWEGAPLADFVAESVRLNVQAYRSTAPLFRAALLAAVRDPSFRRRRLATLRLCADLQKQLVLTRARRDDVCRPGPGVRPVVRAGGGPPRPRAALRALHRDQPRDRRRSGRRAHRPVPPRPRGRRTRRDRPSVTGGAHGPAERAGAYCCP